MKKFKFTLATPLRVKLTQERQMQGELAAATHRLRQMQEERDGLQFRFDTAAELYSQRLTQGGVSLADMKTHSIGFTALRMRIADSEKKTEAADSEVLRIAHRLQTLNRERRVLEEVRTKQLAAYRVEAEHERERQLDDFVSAQQALMMRK